MLPKCLTTQFSLRKNILILTRVNIYVHTLGLKKKGMTACPTVRSKTRFFFFFNQSSGSVRLNQGDSLRNLTACYLTGINTCQLRVQFRNSMPTHCIQERTETWSEWPKHKITSLQREIKEYSHFPMIITVHFTILFFSRYFKILHRMR